jgi:hypothetical protein
MAVLIAVAATCCSLPLLCVVLLIFGDKIDNWRHQRKFDAALWKADVFDKKMKKYVFDSRWPPRLCMVDDLMASSCLLGKSKGQVTELLGPPDSTTHFGPPDETTPFQFEYHLGPERGFIRIDSEALGIEFDREGKVNSQRILRD